MFEKMIESQPQGAVRSRRSYFAVTTFGISLLSLSAIVVSIFADDFSLGTGAFELTELIAPIEMAAVEPPQPKPRQALPKTQQTSKSQMPMRTDNVANIVETPTKVPPISTTPSTQVSRPVDGRFELGPMNSNPDVSGGGPSRDAGPSGDGIAAAGISTPSAPIAKDVEVEAPKAEKKPEAARTKSGGVLNGQAIDLPKPVYSAAAKAVHAQGKVTVQVVVDESGNVISASVVDGHILLRASAEAAARRARFTPTRLSGVPVKVTGVIVYNFVA